MSVPERLALRRKPDKSFVLLGSVAAETKTEVAVTTADGVVETHPRSGLVFVTPGSINYFARLDPEGLRRAFQDVPRAVFEQALLDATVPLSTSELKTKLTQAGLARAAVDKAWSDTRKAWERNPDVSSTGAGSAKKFSWTGATEARLREYIATTQAQMPLDDWGPKGTAPGPDPQEFDRAAGTNRSLGDHVNLDFVEAAEEILKPNSKTVDDANTPRPNDLLLTVLSTILGAAAPRSLDEIRRSVMRVGTAMSAFPTKELKILAQVPEAQRDLVNLLLLARERQLRLWSHESDLLDPRTAIEAIESAIEEASRSSKERHRLAHFTARVLRRTHLTEVPLTIVARAFVRAAGEESESEPSKPLLDLADALADRAQTSVSLDWDQADPLIKEIARGMSRIPLDEGGPRSKFIAALYVTRRHHLNDELLWKNTDLHALDLAASGVLRRVLLDADLADRVVRPEVARYISECRTRHGLGKLMALRGSFAQFVDARTMATVMGRVAIEDPKAREWLVELRQKDRLDAVVRERDAALREATTAKAVAEEADLRIARAIADRDAARTALNHASEASAKTSDARLRQAKIDVLRSLAALAVTIQGSSAAKEDPALLQRLAFALHREGLTEIAAPGEAVTYDPILHDAQGEHIDPGSPVSAERSGYTFDSGDESLVLVKAHVSVI